MIPASTSRMVKDHIRVLRKIRRILVKAKGAEHLGVPGVVRIHDQVIGWLFDIAADIQKRHSVAVRIMFKIIFQIIHSIVFFCLHNRIA